MFIKINTSKSGKEKNVNIFLYMLLPYLRESGCGEVKVPIVALLGSYMKEGLNFYFNGFTRPESLYDISKTPFT